MATRRGLSIGVKLILATTLLILLIVGLFGFLNILNIQTIYDEQAKRQQEIIEQSTRDHGSSQLATLSEGIKNPLKGNEFDSIHQMLLRAKAQDVLVKFIWLLNDRGRRVSSSDAKENEEFKKAWDANPEAIKAFTHELLTKEFTAAVTGKGGAKTVGKKGKDGALSEQIHALVRNYKGERVMLVARPLVAEGEVLGTAFIVYSLERLKEQQQRIARTKEKAFSQAWQRTAMVGAVFMLIGLLVSILQSLRISKPIRTLTARATQISQGDLMSRVEVQSSDELGQLAENFNFMADQLVILLQETASKATFQKELEVARSIQEALVPSSELVDRPFLRLSGYFGPATECGGDWWTYHDLEDGKVLVIIADVTGHGVPSAMITAVAKAAVDTLRVVTNDNLTVTYLLEILNRAIFESAKRKFVMTCFASIIDPKANTITFANAGHNFPYLYREEDGQAKFNVLMTRGNRLGDMESSTYQPKQEEIRPGDVIVWYTDGIVECESEIGEEYGEKRFRNSIRKLAPKEPDEIRDGVILAANQFFGNMPRKDDITLVIGRYYEPGTAPPMKARPRTAEEEATAAAELPPAGDGAQKETSL
jgi:serine phosphatase RsbU (regulator of sigma subunit)